MAGLEFRSWARPELVHTGTRQPSGRLGRDLQVTLTDSHAGAAPAAGVHIEFRSATDIGTLTRKAVRRRLPAPGSTDAETTKCPHVDLSGPDLPWRYTPEGLYEGAPEKLRPWLALVVGSTSEVKVEGDVAVIEPAVLRDYPLTQSWRWAHIHTPADAPDQEITVRSTDRVARIVSLRPLAPLTLYTAVLVRTFSEAGSDSWDANGIPAAGSTVRALASWSFTTGEGGDFETLAARLQMPPSEDIGKAELRYCLGSLAEADKVLGPIDVRGALASLASVREPATQDQAAMAEQMAGLVRQLTSDPDLLGPPDYGRPWVAEPSTHTIGWMQQLREDARFRIHAGTGVWTGVEAQDALMAAAVQQAGALAEATGKISRAAAGLLASSSQWERALPSTPLGRLAVLGPMSPRLPVADTGGSVARTIGGPDRPLDPALLSGAGARLLSRPTRVHRNRGHSPADLLGAANRPPDESTETLRRLESLWEEQGLLDALHYLWELLLAWAEARHGDAESLVDKGVIDCSIRELIMVEFGLDEWEGLSNVLDGSSTAAGLVYGRAQTALLRCVLHCTGPRQPDRRCQVRMAMMRIPQPRQLRQIHLEGLAEAISTAVDPRGPDSPARRRLQAEITGLSVDSLTPPRYPLGLDFPSWTVLREHAPDWLLPGAQALAPHSVIALQTNPEFIDAYLVGLNTQFLAEARWRGLQIDRWGTPLRMFFGPAAATGERLADIVPIDNWPDDSALGAPSHQMPAPGAPQDGDASAERLVILFNSPLFRRYPATLVYLQRLMGDTDIDDLILIDGPRDLAPPKNGTPQEVEHWYQTRTFIAPAFTGTLGPELTFFVFDVQPTDLDDFNLILEEPELELRFRNDQGVLLDSSAAQAARIADTHTRVAMSGRYLKEQGLGSARLGVNDEGAHQ